jgi:heat shock protein 5
MSDRFFDPLLTIFKVPNAQGHRTTPSWVSFSDKERFVGESAKRGLLSNPGKTVFDVKRLIGRSYWDTGVQQDIRHFPFHVINKDGVPAVEIDSNIYSPEEISAMVLRNLKESAETYLGQSVEVSPVLSTGISNSNNYILGCCYYSASLLQ